MYLSKREKVKEEDGERAQCKNLRKINKERFSGIDVITKGYSLGENKVMGHGTPVFVKVVR